MADVAQKKVTYKELVFEFKRLRECERNLHERMTRVQVERQVQEHAKQLRETIVAHKKTLKMFKITFPEESKKLKRSQDLTRNIRRHKRNERVKYDVPPAGNNDTFPPWLNKSIEKDPPQINRAMKDLTSGYKKCYDKFKKNPQMKPADYTKLKAFNREQAVYLGVLQDLVDTYVTNVLKRLNEKTAPVVADPPKTTRTFYDRSRDPRLKKKKKKKKTSKNRSRSR